MKNILLESTHPEHIRTVLSNLAEVDYQKFSSKLIPGVENLLGVRIPTLRKIGTEIAKRDPELFLENVENLSFEETMLEGLVIASLQIPFSEKLALVAGFVPKINNWSVCDSFCNSLKFGSEYIGSMFKFLKKYLNSQEEYHQRFGLVMLLNHYVSTDYIERTLSEINSPKWKGFYSEMAAAWALATCFSKFPDQSLPFYLENELSYFTHNKAIQKAIESRLVSSENKDLLRSLRRKKTHQKG